MDTVKEMNKARILRETAERVEGEDFSWRFPGTCVVGNMAKIIGVENPIGNGEAWTDTARNWACQETGLSGHSVIAALQSCGFSIDEIERAEFGSSVKYAEWIEYQNLSGLSWEYETVPAIARRLRDWATEIETAVMLHQQQSGQLITVPQRAIG